MHIDLDNLSVVASKHAEERSRRHVGQRGRGGARAGKISRDTVRRALDRALPDILDDFAARAAFKMAALVSKI